MKKWIFVILVIFLVTACSGMRKPNTAEEDFYKGTNGAVATFEHFPQRLFFYSEPGHAENQFEVSVEVRNQGASWTRGAIFLSGYDPNLIQFHEVPILGGQLGACGLSLGSIGLGEFGGVFSCEGVTIGGSSGGNFFADIDSFASLMGWDPNKFDFSLDTQQFNGEWQFTMNMIDPNIDMEYLGRGRLFIAMFSGIDFTRTLGREYVLPGRSYEYPSGGSQYLTYTGEIQQSGWTPGIDELKQPILMTNCYFYTTHAAPLVCIDPDPYSENQKVCQPRQLSFSGSQGAPVAITSVEQENGPRMATFRINIQNSGRGEVFDPGMLEKCSPYLADRVRPEDKNVVYVGDVRIGNRRLQDCIPNGVVRLHNGRGTITCQYPLEYVGLKSAYETPLYVELWYGYVEHERRDLTIKRVT